jgi:hypothetical protein
MTRSNKVKIAFALVLFGTAGFFIWRFLQEDSGISEKAFFYDESERRLFTAARTAIPPIKGLNDSIEDGVSAVVISVTGKPKDRNSWKIAYLEKYSPELKAAMAKAQRTGEAPEIGRGLAQKLRFVRHEGDNTWHSLESPEGEKIVSQWAVPTKDGITPIVCTP